MGFRVLRFIGVRVWRLTGFRVRGCLGFKGLSSRRLRVLGFTCNAEYVQFSIRTLGFRRLGS